MSPPPAGNAVAHAAAVRASRKPYFRARRFFRPSVLIGGFVALACSIYIGFLYRPNLTTYNLVQEEHPTYARLQGVPTKHFKFAVRTADGNNAVLPALDPNKFKVTFHVEPPLSGANRSGQLAKATVFDVGQGNFLVSFRMLEGVPTGHVLKGVISYRGKIDSASLSPLKFELVGPVHEPTCKRQVDPAVFEYEAACPKEFSQIISVSRLIISP